MHMRQGFLVTMFHVLKGRYKCKYLYPLQCLASKFQCRPWDPGVHNQLIREVGQSEVVQQCELYSGLTRWSEGVSLFIYAPVLIELWSLDFVPLLQVHWYCTRTETPSNAMEIAAMYCYAVQFDDTYHDNYFLKTRSCELAINIITVFPGIVQVKTEFLSYSGQIAHYQVKFILAIEVTQYLFLAGYPNSMWFKSTQFSVYHYVSWDLRSLGWREESLVLLNANVPGYYPSKEYDTGLKELVPGECALIQHQYIVVSGELLLQGADKIWHMDWFSLAVPWDPGKLPRLELWLTNSDHSQLQTRPSDELRQRLAEVQWLWDPGGYSPRPAWGQAGFQGGKNVTD
jgi:hypothetical protein